MRCVYRACNFITGKILFLVKIKPRLSFHNMALLLNNTNNPKQQSLRKDLKFKKLLITLELLGVTNKPNLKI